MSCGPRQIGQPSACLSVPTVLMPARYVSSSGGSSENGISVTYLDEEATLGITLAFPLLLLVLDLFVEVALAVLIILMTAILPALASLCLRLRVRSVRAHRNRSRTITTTKNGSPSALAILSGCKYNEKWRYLPTTTSTAMQIHIRRNGTKKKRNKK